MKVKVFEDKFSENKIDGFIFEPHSHFKIYRKSLEFGDVNRYRPDSIAKIDIKKVKNFELLFDFKLIKDYRSDSWIGIKVRSTSNLLTDGYLIYIRSNGNSAIYTAGNDLPNAQFQISNSILNQKVSLKIRLEESKFTLSINDAVVATYVDIDNKILRNGNIYIYSNYTKSLLYQIKIWQVIKMLDLQNNLVRFLLFILFIIALVFVVYHFFPNFVNDLINDPRFLLFQGIKP